MVKKIRIMVIIDIILVIIFIRTDEKRMEKFG